MKSKSVINYVWTLINAILVGAVATAGWAVASNEKKANLGLLKLLHGTFLGFARIDGLVENAIKVLLILIVLLAFCMIFSTVSAVIHIGRMTVDVWPLWNVVVTALIVVSMFASYKHYCPYYEEQREIYNARALLESERVIVHGAGFIEDELGDLYDYTNSLDALTNAYNMGNRVVELDFLWTSDNKMVCAHESETFARGIESDGALTEEEFLGEKSYGVFTTMNMEMLADFMREHQDLYIVTDFKYELDESCEYIAQAYPDLKDRFIVQMYHYGQYEFIREHGFDNIILTLYLTADDERDIGKLCEFVKSHDLVGITFWESYLDDAVEWGNSEDFWNAVKALDVPTCVHTVNDVDDIMRDFERDVTAVYTDNVDNSWIKAF